LVRGAAFKPWKVARLKASGSSILVVEDEPDIAALLEYVLGQEGYRVVAVDTGQRAIEEAQRHKPDLIILDLMLPDFNGFEALKIIKAREETSQARVIILTAKKEEVDRVLGFELGADDFVTKPFSPRELVLRVRAVLKRTLDGDTATSMLRSGPVEIDLDNHEVTVSGKSVRLTLTEFNLLVDLVRAGGRVRTREALLSELWDYDAEVMSRTVDTHVRRLRTKLGSASQWLTTVRGVGYRFESPPDA
jgi:two-component system phosphate regulon response regulator PhoB